MRENLFHGKRKDNGEWVEGCLLGSDVIVPKGQPFCICHDILDSALKAYEVIPETVGQYIGRKDKNGTKIFEGDVVKNRVRLISGCQIRSLQVVYDSTAARFVLKDEYGDFKNIPEVCEVIGNIYDNPELIGGEANG